VSSLLDDIRRELTTEDTEDTEVYYGVGSSRDALSMTTSLGLVLRGLRGQALHITHHSSVITRQSQENQQDRQEYVPRYDGRLLVVEGFGVEGDEGDALAEHPDGGDDPVDRQAARA
jgi:hypothetical protein